MEVGESTSSSSLHRFAGPLQTCALNAGLFSGIPASRRVVLGWLVYRYNLLNSFRIQNCDGRVRRQTKHVDG